MPSRHCWYGKPTNPLPFCPELLDTQRRTLGGFCRTCCEPESLLSRYLGSADIISEAQQACSGCWGSVLGFN